MTADKVWKGKRPPELEKRLAKELGEVAGCDYWAAWSVVSDVLDSLGAASDERLEWQSRYGLET